jgi:hypothetical protein
MGRSQTILEGKEYSVDSLALLPDGTILSAEYNMLKFWNPDNCECIGSIEEDVVSESVILLPECKLAVCLSTGIKIRLAKYGYQCIRTIKLEGCINYGNLLLLKNGNLVCSVLKEIFVNIMALDSDNDYICKQRLSGTFKLDNPISEFVR